MKIECEKSLLAAAIEGVSRAITNRSAIPVLEGIYLQAEGFKLTLTGYDMEMGITTTIDCNVLVPGEMVLDAKLLGSMVSRMPAGNVTIDMDDEGMAIISGGVAEFEIPAMNASDYPSLPNTKADYAISMPTAQLREMIEKTIYAVATGRQKARPHRRAVCDGAGAADHRGAGRLPPGGAGPQRRVQARHPASSSRPRRCRSC